MKKLLASDIDGTILHIQGTQEPFYVIEPKVLEAIHQFRAAGHCFVLCTGRTLSGVKAVLDEFPLEADALIISGGAALYKMTDHLSFQTKPLARFTIPADLGTEIIDFFYHLNDHVLYWSDGTHDYAFANRHIHWMDENHPHYISIEDWKKNPLPIANLGITPFDLKIESVEKAITLAKQRWGSQVEIHRNKCSLDISHQGVTKGSGIVQLQELLQSTDHICYAAGDSFNDLPMFQQVGKENAYLIEGGEHVLTPYVKTVMPSLAECIEDILHS